MTDALRSGLQQHFGFDDFQPGQRPVIASVLDGVPTLAIMPTGAGKSLCYQLPAVLSPGTTLVISPLIALMKDQVDALNARGIRAALLNSSLDLDQQRAVMDDAASGELDLLYIAPERFGNSWFRDRVQTVDVGLFAIDEAHCISRWGHDFRPDYRRLKSALDLIKPRAVLACTATATPDVRRDIAASLELEDPAVFVSGFLRDNLFIDIRFCGGDNDKERLLLDFLRHGPAAGDGATIIYAPTRKRVEAIAKMLRSALGTSVVAYHAGMSSEDRDDAQDRFINKEADIVVATNAFGMGIDRSDVRAVVHAAMPSTVEGYYQQIGRAGRDGAPSWCLLLYNANDSRVHEFLIDRSDSPEHRDLERQKLTTMKRFVHSEKCRHRSLLSYFGEHVPVECPGCSRCTAAPRYRPIEVAPNDADTETIRKALAGVARSRGRFGAKKVAAMLAGSRAKEVMNSPLGQLSTHGILGGLGQEGCAQLLQFLTDEQLCMVTGDRYPLLTISPLGIEVMRGEVACEVGLPSLLKPRRVAGRTRQRTSPKRAVSPPPDADERVLSALQTWRREAADGKPAFTIFGNRTLFALAAAPPEDREGFLAVPGLGAAKWDRFGEEMLDIIERAQRGDL